MHGWIDYIGGGQNALIITVDTPTMQVKKKICTIGQKKLERLARKLAKDHFRCLSQ
jgi:carbon monoxide dehydrogenase subunit G